MKPLSLGVLIACCSWLAGCVSPLYEAVSNNNLQATQQWILKGEPLNDRHTNAEWTPLMKAAFQGNTEIMTMLLDYGADLNVEDIDHDTALGVAIYYKQAKAAKLLIQRGARMTPSEPHLRDAMTRIIYNNPDPDIVREMLAHGLNPDGDKRNYSYLDTIAGANNEALIPIARLLLEKGARPDWSGPYGGMTPMQTAAYKGNSAMMRLLAAHGAQLEPAREYAKLSPDPDTRKVLQELITDRQNREAAAALKARLAAQPCPIDEKGWFLLSGQCSDGKPNGHGVAETANRRWRFEGTLLQGKLSHGQLLLSHGKAWVTEYEGPFVNGLREGVGVCGPEREACEWQKDQRIDAAYTDRVAREQQQAREQEARNRLARLEEEAREQAERIAAVKECERQARAITDENTSATCDEEGNLQPYRHNRGNQARNAALFNAYNNAMDSIAQQAIAARNNSTNSVSAAPRSQSQILIEQSQQMLRDIEQARARLAAEQQASARLNTTPPPAPVTTASQSKPPAMTAPQWGTPVAEAIAVCWQNGSGNGWFCDGPLQQVMVAEKTMLAARNLVGCRTSDSEIREIGTSGKYRVFGCGRGLRQGERDMRALHGVNGGSNQYRCLKKDMDAGTICRTLSDY